MSCLVLSDSSEYSDWTGEVVNISVRPTAPIPRTQRPSRYRRRVVASVLSDEDEPEQEDEPVVLDEGEDVVVDDAEGARSAETNRKENSNARSRKQRRAVAAGAEETPWQVCLCFKYIAVLVLPFLQNMS